MSGAAAPAVEIERDGELTAQRDAPVGGQAVLEGVMMRGVAHWAVAVRKPVAQEPATDTSASNGAQAASNGGQAALERRAA